MSEHSERLREAALDYSCFDKWLGCEAADALDRAEAVCEAAESFLVVGDSTIASLFDSYKIMSTKVKAWREGRDHGNET
jgi:hypothetical protein